MLWLYVTCREEYVSQVFLSNHDCTIPRNFWSCRSNSRLTTQQIRSYSTSTWSSQNILDLLFVFTLFPGADAPASACPCPHSSPWRQGRAALTAGSSGSLTERAQQPIFAPLESLKNFYEDHFLMMENRFCSYDFSLRKTSPSIIFTAHFRVCFATQASPLQDSTIQTDIAETLRKP